MIGSVRSLYPNVIAVSPAKRTSAAAVTSTSSIFGTDTFMRSAGTITTYTNYTSTGSYVGGVRRGSAYAPRLTQIENIKDTRNKLDEIVYDFAVKRDTGYFASISDNERFAYVYETFSEAFGADFLDFSWQKFCTNGAVDDSYLLKSDIYDEFLSWATDLSSPSKEVRDAKRAAAFSSYFGYGDMTQQEKYDAITAEYAALGDNSYASSYKMLWMLGLTGAVDIDMISAATNVLTTKQHEKYAAQDMSVMDMAFSRYANAFYAYDADSEILDIVDYIQERNAHIIRENPNQLDAFNRQDVQDFFKKLEADLGALGGVIGGVGK